ncbi:hypothetical protein CNMCM5793_005373 [Aspergillus hiratsukae]|uniref:Uncharacterized protein n=1 Tax=Aspergillus hiratsukae TaxID=1194566 RepID=A0A8H6PGF1_9EURO|nr:hypothetical protein CNMCM5793_005373 [Aspergillus hiratsukae]
MQLQFLALLSTLSLVSADLSYYCEMAKDGSAFIQKAYCCDDLVPARYAEQFFQAEKCMSSHQSSSPIIRISIRIRIRSEMGIWNCEKLG